MRSHPRPVALWFFGLVLVAGCSLSPGNKLTVFPQNHTLLDSTKAMLQAVPEPLPLPRELDKRVLPAYVVEPGDVLLVQPAELDSPVRLPADQPVLPDGTINLGRYGRLVVAGMTVDEIERALQEAVAQRTNDAGPITVRIVTRQSKVYYVLGDVNAPGAFPINGRETVLDGILAAGGLTDRASRRNIVLSRPTPPDGCRVVLPICYPEIVQLGDTSTNYQLAPGDRIYVASRHPLEDCKLFESKKVCPPCRRPQTPCGGAPEACGSLPPASGVPVRATFGAGAPVTLAPPHAWPADPAPAERNVQWHSARPPALEP